MVLDRNGAGDRRQHLRRIHFGGVLQGEFPAQLQHQRIDPGLETDLAVFLRKNGGVVIAVLGDTRQRGQHFLGALFGREGGPGRIGGLGGRDGIAHVLRGRRRSMTDHDAGLGRVGDRHPVRGLSFFAPDKQRSGH